MVHARLAAGGENSGKLVTIVREQAKEAAAKGGFETIIVDGAPGIGCPVIASITGADAALAVTEPTLSGLHDIERAIELAGHFGLDIMLAVNRYDINEDMTERIEEFAARRGIPVAGRIRYDADVTRAQKKGMSVVEYSEGPAAVDMREMWERIVSGFGLEVK
jgi:MinD superfamily P-loop ATPase